MTERARHEPGCVEQVARLGRYPRCSAGQIFSPDSGGGPGSQGARVPCRDPESGGARGVGLRPREPAPKWPPVALCIGDRSTINHLDIPVSDAPSVNLPVRDVRLHGCVPHGSSCMAVAATLGPPVEHSRNVLHFLCLRSVLCATPSPQFALAINHLRTRKSPLASQGVRI